MNFLLSFSIFRRNRNFALLYTGQAISFLGTMITGVALPYQIYMQTKSTLMVGLLSLCQLIPLLFTALIGGVFADRYHRRLLLLSAEAVMMIGSLGLALNAALPHPHLWELFLISSVMSAFNGLHRPALDSIVQQIVPKEDFATVSALGTLKGSICMIGGPALGGLLIASFGVFTTYMVDMASFAVSLTALLLMTDIPKPLVQRDDSTWVALKQGIQYALSRQELMGTYIVDFVAMIFGMPTALFPAIAEGFGGAKVLGILYAAPAIGALLISLMSGWVPRVKRHGAAIALAAAGWGICIILFGLAPTFTLAITAMVMAGAFDAVSGIFRSTMWNETIPQRLRGRMAGIEMISYLSGPRLGDTEAGLIAAAFGITVSVVSGGVLCLVSVIVCSYFLPKFWQYDATNFKQAD
jgi:MFS family permease